MFAARVTREFLHHPVVLMLLCFGALMIGMLLQQQRALAQLRAEGQQCEAARIQRLERLQRYEHPDPFSGHELEDAWIYRQWQAGIRPECFRRRLFPD